LAQSYDLTWHDIYLILSSTVFLEERQRVWDEAREHADDVQTTPAHLVGTTAVPDQEPNWEYQNNRQALWNHMVTCLVSGLKGATQKVVNFHKIREIHQEKEKNPAHFLSFLTEALQHNGTIVLMTHYISQAAPDIRKKLNRLENGPWTPQAEILNVVFKVYN
jgi:hypothetical protein